MSINRLVLGSILVFLAAVVARAVEVEAPVIEGWGQVVDPDGDCEIKQEGTKLTMVVPGTHHNLNPRIALNAPRVVQPVSGDFTATVRVTGDFHPSKQSTLPSGYSFNGAGLVLWKDAKNFVRVERNAWSNPDQAEYVCYPPLVEYYRDGQFKNSNPPSTNATFFKGRSTYLRLQRKGDRATVSYSHDGKEWTAVKELLVDLPEKLEIGVAAVSTSEQPFRVEFDELEISAGQ